MTATALAGFVSMGVTTGCAIAVVVFGARAVVRAFRDQRDAQRSSSGEQE